MAARPTLNHQYLQMLRGDLSKSSKVIQRGQVAVANSIALLKRSTVSDSGALISGRYSAAQFLEMARQRDG